MPRRYENQDPYFKAVAKMGARLREARQSREYTQEELSAAVGRNKVWLSFIETGHNGINVLDLAKLADFLDFPVDYFFQDIVKRPSERRSPRSDGDWHELFPGETQRAIAHAQLDRAFRVAAMETSGPRTAPARS